MTNLLVEPSIDGDWMRIVDQLTRRQFVAGTVATALLAACGSDDGGSRGAGDGDWSFTDDRGEVVSLPGRPERIVAYIGTAAALWDFGVRPVGVMGQQRDADGEPIKAVGRVDLDAVTSVGEETVDLEALAALRPDLVVLQVGTSGLDPWPVTDDQLDEVRRIAPILGSQGYGARMSDILAGYERLAAALGVDFDAPAVRQARRDLDAATDDLRAAVAAKPGLVAMFTSANNEGMFVAKVEDFPDLTELRRLGLDIVEAGGPDDYFQTLSWEQAGRHPADLIFHDERPGSLQPDELRRFPTWTALPAVRAGQVRPWNAEAVFSHWGLAEVFAAIAEAVRGARTDLV